MKRLVAAAWLLLLMCAAGLAQGVNVIGAVTPGHCVSFFSTSQIQDSGGACGGGGGGGITGPGVSTVGDLAVWNNATGSALADTNLSFPGGFSFAGTLTGATAVTFPTSGTLATTATANVASVTGTTGQITVTPTTGAVVVSLPATITANLTVSGTINNTGTFQVGGSTMAFPATADTLAGLGTVQTFTAAQAYTAPHTFTIAQTLASATAANWRNVYLAPATTTITGNTGSPITALNTVEWAQQTLTDASAVTVTNAATLFVQGAPLASGSVTLTNAWAIRVGAGNVSFPGAGNVLGTITSGTWNGSLIGLTFGGTNNALTASVGGIVWSDASKLNILAGTSTAGLCLLSGNLATPAWTTCPGGGGTPGGANTNVQFNASSTFGGDAGFTYVGNGQVTHALGTITTNNKALNITGTWNAAGTTFDAPLFVNITNTASAAASTLFDIQVGGTPLLILQPNTNAIMSLGDGATASAFRVYNTVDTLAGPTNYERAVFDFGVTTANTLTVGTQQGGTGSARGIQILATTGLVNIVTSPACGCGTQINAWSGGMALWTLGGTNTQLNSANVLGWSSTNFASAAADLSISRVVPKVVAFGDGAANANGWIQWAGEARVTADFSVTSSIALTNVTGLAVNVAAGRTYQFATELYVTDAAAGGVQAAIAGTATATAIQYVGFAIADNAIKAKTNATALATAVASTVTTETTGIIVRITGTITVNAAGTLTVQMAQNTSNATATIAKRGSWLIVNDMP